MTRLIQLTAADHSITRKNSAHLPYLRGVLLLVCSTLFVAWSGQTYGQCPQICDANTSNTALGIGALVSITTGADNTAVGFDALFADTSGGFNTAVGFRALNLNTTGFQNTAMGLDALQQNTTGSNNTAFGEGAMDHNSTGSNNTAVGGGAAIVNDTGNNNTAVGFNALLFNSTSNNNTAMGSNALSNTTGTNNIGLGNGAGSNLGSGSNNIYIGTPGGAAGESNRIRIGTIGPGKNAFVAGIFGVTVGTGIPVIVDSSGRLGTTTSSERFKDAIRPMDKASEAILALQPVTFRYKQELDPDRTPQFGLTAEQVEKVDPDLVARDEQGKPYSVRYEAVNAMLLNEFLKEHRRVEQLEKQVEALTAGLQKVSDQLEASKPAPQVVNNP
jgi:Chaperone of endosialidase